LPRNDSGQGGAAAHDLSPVTDQEVLEQYTFANEKVKISYVEFKPDQFKNKVKVEPAAMEKYFEDNKETYRILIKSRRPTSCLIRGLQRQVKVSEDQLKEYYEDNPDTFKEKKQVKARHILFMLAENASKEDEEKIRQKATSVLQQARQEQTSQSLQRRTPKIRAGKKTAGSGVFFPRPDGQTF